MNGLDILGLVALAGSLFACRAFQLDANRWRQRAIHAQRMADIAEMQRDDARFERDLAQQHAEQSQAALNHAVAPLRLVEEQA